MNNEYKPISNHSEDFDNTTSSVSIKEEIEKYLYYWKWFVISVLVALVIAVIYLRYATKQYQTTAEILLNEKGSTSPELDALTDAAASFSGMASNAVVNDQIKIIKSRRLLRKVVAANKLHIKYTQEGSVKKSPVLAANAPVLIAFSNDSLFYNKDFEGSIKGSVQGNQIKINDSDFLEEGTYSLGTAIPSDFGSIRILKNNAVFDNNTSYAIGISFVSIEQEVESILQKIDITPDADKKSMAVLFNVVDELPERSELLINEIIKTYNTDSKEDSNQIAEITAQFITDRLEIISTDLEGVDRNLEQFKTANKINDAEAEAGIYLNDALNVDRQVVELGAQLQIVQQLKQSLSSDKNVLLPTPTSIGIENRNLPDAINAYNMLVLEKMDLSKSATPNNIFITQLEKNIADLKESIQSSLDLYASQTQTRLKSVESKKSEISNRLDLMPLQERGFRTIARQQKIVESIYLFLLEKREEAEIRSAANVDAIKVVDLAYTQKNPVAPKTKIILLAALILGFIIPFAVIYLKNLIDNKVKDRKDIKAVYDGAFLGDIPLSEEVLIQENDRSSLAESFRILRSNLSFLLPKEQGGKVVFVTSTTSGEGKTFTAINLTQILALTDKKVVLVAADIRKPRVLEQLGIDNVRGSFKGLSDYLSDPALKPEHVILSEYNSYTFDIIPPGTIPPNPAELFMQPHFGTLMEYLKSHYDYIVVDTAPVALVTDTQIIAPYADVSIYVVRSNYLDKRMLNVLTDLYREKKLKNMAVVLNAVDYDRGYGYGYGYSYGYGNENKKRKFWQLGK